MSQQSRWLRAVPQLIALALCVVVGEVHAHNGACANSTQMSDAATSASKALEARPQDLDARLALADVLMVDNCFEDAVRILEEGQALHGSNARFESELREARSMVREQGYFEGLNRAEAAAKLSHNLLRCNKLGDLEACDAALALKPEEPSILSAKGDALVKANRPADALGAYQQAQRLAPGDSSLVEKIGAAQAQRRSFAATCMNGTEGPALQACQSALMPGGEDEFAIRKRTGVLLQAANQPSAALDSYIAANLINGGDRSVALSIVALSDSTRRTDAMAQAARGSALLSLGRALDALTPLRQALALSPDLPGAKAQLAKAEALAQKEAQRIVAANRQARNTTEQQASTVMDAKEPVPESPPAQAPPSRRYSNTAPATRSN